MTVQLPTLYSEMIKRVSRLIILSVVIAPAAFFVALSIWAPSDIIDRWSWIQKCIAVVQSGVARSVPWIDIFRHARSTQFPQVATITTALAILWWPVMTAGLLLLMSLSQRQGRADLRSGRTALQLLFLTMFSLPVGVFCFVVFFGIPGDPSFAAGFTSESRLGYAVMGVIEVMFSSLLIASWPFFTLSFFDSLFHRDQHA